MTAPPRYLDLIRDMKSRFNYRLSLVSYARHHGIKAAARLFQTTVPTVRKWLRRYQAKGLKGLEELSRAPRSCPHRIREELEAPGRGLAPSASYFRPFTTGPTSWPKLRFTSSTSIWVVLNSHKGGLTPWEIVHQLDCRLSLRLCFLPPVFLDYRLDPEGGYDVPFQFQFKKPLDRI